MVEQITSYSPDREKIIFQGKLKKEIKREEKVKHYIDKASEAKSFKAWCSSRKMLATLNNDKETELIFDAVIKKYEEFEIKREKNIKTRYIIRGADMWQGKHSYELTLLGEEEIYITEFRKQKGTEEVVEGEPIKVEIDKINFLLSLVNICEIGIHQYARDIWKAIIGRFDLKKEGVDTLNFNGGGKMRSTFYFKYYLYPLRTLEFLGIVKIVNGGNGGFKRLK